MGGYRHSLGIPSCVLKFLLLLQGGNRAHLGAGVPAKRCAPIRPSVLPVLDESRQESLELRKSVGDERGPAKVTDGQD